MVKKPDYQPGATQTIAPHNEAPVLWNEQLWKIAFYIISACVLGCMLLVSHSYGLSGDEWLQIKYGQDIWNYYAHGNMQALNYENLNTHYVGQQYYGGLFEFSTEALHHLLPSINHIHLRHFANAGMGATMMIVTGLLAKRISGKWHIALLALVFISFSPRIFGESMNNPKDIPFACGFIICIYSLVAFLQDYPTKRIKYATGIALGFAIAFGIRSAGGFMLLTFIALFLTMYFLPAKYFKDNIKKDNNKQLKSILLYISAALAVGYIVALLAWPWALQSPVSNPIASILELSHRGIYFKVLFEGVYRMNYNMPWYYELKWMLISNPVIVLAGIVVFIAFFAKAIKKYGLFAVTMLSCCAFLPLVYIVYQHSAVYDSWRHVFFVYPMWVVMSALAFDMLGDMVRKRKLRAIPLSIAIAALLPVMIWTVRSHPFQYIYFNELEGGVSGAYSYYDLDYYQNAAKQSTDWIKANARPVAGRKIIVLSNILGIDAYFDDTARFTIDTGVYEDRHFLNYDYFISNGRYVPVAQLRENRWPPQNVVYSISMDGKPLSVVLVKKSYIGNEAHNAFAKEDYATAVKKYEEYLRVDSLDEEVYVNYALSLVNIDSLDKSARMLSKAATFNPLNASYYQGLKSIYELLGDNVKAEESANKVNNARYEEQELNPPLQEP